ncbi:hypothetical protein [Laceyella putida]|uniref:Uncharacterized protein n=1 Tax=Laceyella putida TaxID=110101 RepID=A0ABW2RQF5_9BACL
MERCDSCRNEVEYATQVEPEYFLCEKCREEYEEEQMNTIVG